MKVLITGGAGFIGSHIADRYLKEGHEVVIIDDLSVGKRQNVSEQAKFYQVDITNATEVERIIAEEKPQVINHHAAQKNVRVSTEEPAEDARINILGGLNLLTSAKRHGVKRVIFASTGGAIYGEADKIPTPEAYPAMPLSPYGIAKLTFENYLRFFEENSGPVPVMLRYANVYGPRQDPEGEAGVISIFVDKLLAGEQSIIFGDGNQTRDFVYVGDVVEANALALQKGDSQVINIGTGIETSVNELYEGIRRVIGADLEARYEDPRAGEVARSCLDAGLAKEFLGWEPQVTLGEGLGKTVEFMRKR